MSDRSRRPLVAGNWKMYTTPVMATELVSELRRLLPADPRAEVVLLPPFTSIWAAEAAREGDPRLGLGAQDCHWEREGAFTGEEAAEMLTPPCRYCLAGHSERRQLFGETDEQVSLKVAAIARSGMTPILAVGETAEQREAGRQLEVIESQTRAGLGGVNAAVLEGCVVAYEPIWSIGTGHTARPEDAAEAAGAIRRAAAATAAAELPGLRVLYGGSVTGSSATEMFSAPGVDGGLIGGASLRAEDFCRIVEAAGAVCL